MNTQMPDPNINQVTTPVPMVAVKAPALINVGARPEVAYQTAHDLLARRFPAEALDVIAPALADDPENSGLRQLQAWAFMIRAQLTKAEDVLISLVADAPDDSWSRHALGRVLERQGKYAEALGHLKLAAVMSDDYEHHASVVRVTRFSEYAANAG